VITQGAPSQPSNPRSPSLEAVRTRLVIAVFAFLGVFLLLGARLVELGLSSPERVAHAATGGIPIYVAKRADITDRNGIVLATNLETSSLYADPAKVLDAADAAEKLSTVFPDLAKAELVDALHSGRRFVWVRRKLTPQQMVAVNALGLPGFSFRTEEERVYPQGPLFSHAVGFVDVDGRGLAGTERYFDKALGDPAYGEQDVRLTLDARVQFALHDEMKKVFAAYRAKGAAGLVLDVTTGEVLALVSLPDFDPNLPSTATPEQRFNRVVQGVYELGSIFKTLTFAIGFDTGRISMSDGYDASKPLKVGKFLIRDDHPKNRFLTVPEIFIYSSNIGAAQMALDIGADNQRVYLEKLGLLTAPLFEMAEVGRPLYPDPWREINTMTIAYGHGIAVSPLQMAAAIAATVNGGILIPATLVDEGEPRKDAGTRVFSEDASAKMRALMRLTVIEGTGKQADVKGYLVGGKTGTAEKAGAGAYQEHALLSSFAGVFPMDAPRYLILIVLDEPTGTAATFNYSGGGWVAAPAVGSVILRIAPMLGVAPRQRELVAVRDVVIHAASNP
jgi:cell division protein FtsI (penicillin-binding protein 3)